MIFLLLYMLTGAVAGFAGGMFGIGGGVIVVPALIYLLSAEGVKGEVVTQMALATSLAAMIVTSLSSALAHYRLGNVLVAVFYRLSIGVCVGAVVGVSLVTELAGVYLQLLFAVFLLYVAWQMLAGFSVSCSRGLPGTGGMVACGAGIGMFSTFFGIGGGTLTVPFLGWCGARPLQAIGTSAALGVSISILGALSYVFSGAEHPNLPIHSLGFVYLPAFAGIVLTSAIAARLGAITSSRMSDRPLQRSFALLLVLVAGSLIWHSLASR